MNKQKSLLAFMTVMTLVLMVLSASCFDSGGSDSTEIPCTYVAPDYGWHGPYSLTTSDPISSSGNYYYDMYCSDVVAGRTYELQLRSPNGYWIGLSIWEEDGSEDEVEYINSNMSTPRYRTATSTGRAHFSVWIHKDELAGGSATYQFYLMEQ